MPIIKSGPKVDGRFQVINGGLDFGRLTVSICSGGEIKLKRGAIIDGISTASSVIVYDENGNEHVILYQTASAVNYTKITNAATGAGPTIEAAGGDTNIDLNLKGKGTGIVKLDGLEENVTMGLGGTAADNGENFPHNVITKTEAAAAFCKIADATAFLNISGSSSGGGITSDYQLSPDTAAENDAVYFGGAATFAGIYIDISATNQTYNADSVTWEYYNGTAWTALTILHDYTDSTAHDGKRPFQADGWIIFTPPTDWAAVAVDSQSAYWIRARYNATVGITQAGLLDSHEHYLFTSAAAAHEVPADGVIGRARLSWGTVSGSTADTKIRIYNATQKTWSAEKTLTKAVREHEIADLGLTVSKDDQLLVFYTDEDGTTEFANGTMEYRLKRTY